MNNKLKKKVMSISLTLVTICLLFSATAFAYGAQSISFSFGTGGGGDGYVDGSVNGKYYSFTPGSVHAVLKDSSNCYNGGTYNVYLYRKASWFHDTQYGKRSCNSSPGRMHTS